MFTQQLNSWQLAITDNATVVPTNGLMNLRHGLEAGEDQSLEGETLTNQTCKTGKESR